MEMHDRGTAATNEQIKEHHFAEGPEHPLKGVVLSRALKRIYSYANCNMSSAEQAVFGQLIMAHEAEIYRPDHEPRHALSNVTREARLPVHKAALYVYEHMLAMDDLGDTIKNVTQTQGCVKGMPITSSTYLSIGVSLNWRLCQTAMRLGVSSGVNLAAPRLNHNQYG